MSPQRYYATAYTTDTMSPWTEPYHLSLEHDSSMPDEKRASYDEENQPTHDALSAIYNPDWE